MDFRSGTPMRSREASRQNYVIIISVASCFLCFLLKPLTAVCPSRSEWPPNYASMDAGAKAKPAITQAKNFEGSKFFGKP